MPKDNLIDWLREKGELYERIGQHDYRERMVEAADELTRKQALIEEMVEGLNTIDAAVVMAAERLSCHAQTVAHSLEGGQLKGVMGHNAADLFKASTALRSLITKATDG